MHLDDGNRSVNHRYFTTTGRDGIASLAGIAPGKYCLEVVHPSFPPAKPEIAIADGEQRRETVKLGPFAELDGCVRLANGGAVPGATVFLDDAASMLQRTTQTDKDGKFRLARLAVGQHWLWINPPDFHRKVELHAGQQSLEIPLPGSQRIAGQLVDPEGRPLAGWNVLARPASLSSRMWARTTADGRFAFDGVSDTPYLLDVADRHRAVATFTDVRTDGLEAVYRLPATAVPKAFVVGRVDGAGGCLLVISRRGAINDDGDELLTVPADGRFEFGPYPRVVHDVGILRPGGNRIWWFTAADLATTDRFDLGTIHVPDPGTLEVTVRDDLGCKKLWVGVRDLALGGTSAPGLEQIDREHWRATDLPPGEYEVYLSAEETAPVFERIAIASSRTAKVTLMTAPGAVLAWRLMPPPGTPDEAVGQQGVTIRNADGAVVACHRTMGALGHRERLLEGSYAFEVTTGGGFHGTATVAVTQEGGAEVLIPIVR